MEENLYAQTLYGAAMFAARMDQQESDEQGAVIVPLNVSIDMFVCFSLTWQQAYDAATRQALEKWPTSEGWTGHRIVVREIRLGPDYSGPDYSVTFGTSESEAVM